MLRRLRNSLYDLLQRRGIVFGLGLGVTAAVVGGIGGVVPELAFIAATLGWLAWEAHPNLLFTLGFHRRAAAAARALADGAGPSLRGDVHRLTEAAALLTVGEIEEAKQALALVEPARLPPRGRFVHFLNLSALFCRIGDGESALAMVEASQAEVEGLAVAWRGLPAINRSAALCELGRFDEAAELLGELEVSRLPPGAHSYYFNNLAWALAMGSGDKSRALRFARRAVALRGADPGCVGTLGVAMVLAGCEERQALPHLDRSLSRLERRSPHGQAVLLSLAAAVHRAAGHEARARELEATLRALPAGVRGRAELARALAETGRTLLLPAAT